MVKVKPFEESIRENKESRNFMLRSEIKTYFSKFIGSKIKFLEKTEGNSNMGFSIGEISEGRVNLSLNNREISYNLNLFKEIIDELKQDYQNYNISYTSNSNSFIINISSKNKIEPNTIPKIIEKTKHSTIGEDQQASVYSRGYK